MGLLRFVPTVYSNVACSHVCLFSCRHPKMIQNFEWRCVLPNPTNWWASLYCKVILQFFISIPYEDALNII